MQQKHILITGGAGFIGSRLIAALFERNPGIQITCVDNFDPFYPKAQKITNLAAFAHRPGFMLVEEDISTPGFLPAIKQVVQNRPVHAIVHLAAKAGVRPSIEDPAGYLKTNVFGLQQVLEFSESVQCPQFIFASSSSVYGVNPQVPWREEAQLMPISPYAQTKLTGEMMGHVYSHLTGLRFLALRFFTVYGPGQRPDLAIHSFTRKIVNEQPITLFGDGTTRRDYTFVEDIITGIIGALNYTQTKYEIINLGNHESVALKDMVHTLESALGKKAIIQWAPEQPGDVPLTYASIDKAAKLLGYMPLTTFPEGIQKFTAWFRSQH